jgi:hypothetical protein
VAVPSKRIRLILQVAALLLFVVFMLLTTVFRFVQPHIKTLVVVGLVAIFLALLLVLRSKREKRGRTQLLLKMGLFVIVCTSAMLIFARSFDGFSLNQRDDDALASKNSEDLTAETESGGSREIDRDVFIVGDSAITGLRLIPGSQVALHGFNVTLDLESCRRLVKHNCKSREGRQVDNTIDTILNRAFGEHDTLVVGVGYNDKSTDFSNDFDAVILAARSRGFSQVIWLNYRETSEYLLPGVDYTSDYSLMNEILRDKIASGAFKDVVIADLWRYTSSVPEWFVQDGVHYKLSGAFGVADFVSRTIASLDGVPCHKPWTLGGSVDSPCPRPEEVVAQRGLVDLAGLYGI